jgi:tripartite-type tricarboxylate transporter receptor subunit TctC
MTGTKRRDFLKLTAGASAAALFAPAIVRAQSDFPNGPVQFVVPFSPGGGADRTARLFAPHLSEELGVPVNVVNIDGGGGWVAWQQMAQWDPETDDHIIGTINLPHVFSYLDPRMNRSETTDSFNFLAWHSLDPCIWAVRHNEDRFDDLQSFLDYVAAHPNEVIMSTTAVGSDDHMGIAFAEKFLPNFKVKKLYANGDSKKLQEVIGGVSDAVAGNVGYYYPYVDNEEIKFITVLHGERYHEVPDLPTFKEVTGENNVSFAGRTTAVAPGLAQEKFDIYLAAFERAMNNPEYQAQEAADRNNLLFMKGDEMRAMIDETRKYVESIRFWEMEG